MLLLPQTLGQWIGLFLVLILFALLLNLIWPFVVGALAAFGGWCLFQRWRQSGPPPNP